MKATTALSHHEFRTALSQCILLSLERLNNLGHGIFVMVNEGDGNGRAAKNVTAIRALFTDDDQGSADVQGATGLQPSLVIVSKRGKHSYLRVKPGAPLDAFGSAQKALAVKCGTDPKICDLPRVMRLPGFFHVKDPADPFLVRIEQTCESAVYAVEETMAVLGAASDNATETAPPAERRRSTSSAYEQARAFVAKQPAAVEGEAGDNATFSHCCALVLGFDLTDDDALELLAEWNRRCVPPWSEADLSDKLDYARKYGTEEVGGRVRSEEIAYVVPLEKYLLRDAQGAWALDSPVAQTAAKKYLRDRGFTADEIKSIICSDEIIFAYGFDCVAGKPPVFVRGDRLWLNNFMPGGVEPKAGDFPRIRRIIDTVTANDASGAEWLLDWMAQKVQNPDARNQTAVVLHGEQGTGKTTLVFLLAEMIGPRNAVSISQSELESSFNSIFASKLLVIADEGHGKQPQEVRDGPEGRREHEVREAVRDREPHELVVHVERVDAREGGRRRRSPLHRFSLQRASFCRLHADAFEPVRFREAFCARLHRRNRRIQACLDEPHGEPDAYRQALQERGARRVDLYVPTTRRALHGRA